MEQNQKINHWCVVCGKGYHACDSCNKEKSYTPWRVLTDTIEHYKIFMILKNYNNKLISKEHAQEMLLSLDLTGMELYKDGAKNVLNQIFSVDSDNIDISVKAHENMLPKKRGNKSQKTREDQNNVPHVSGSVIEQGEKYE